MKEDNENIAVFARRWMSEKEIEPGDDWPPTLVLRHGQRVELAELPGELANSEPGKNLVTAVAIRAVHAVTAVEACLGLSAWMVKADDDTEFDAEHPVSSDPRRVEALVLCCWLESGDETWIAEVTRDVAERPSVGEWTQLPEIMESRFDSIGEAVVRNRAS